MLTIKDRFLMTIRNDQHYAVYKKIKHYSFLAFEMNQNKLNIYNMLTDSQEPFLICERNSLTIHTSHSSLNSQKLEMNIVTLAKNIYSNF